MNKRKWKFQQLASSNRGSRGAAVIAICTILGLIVIPFIGLFAFDIGRTVLAQQELQNATDSAALAAAATIASNSEATLTLAHQKAIQAALDMVKRNSIFNVSLKNAQVVSQLSPTPGRDKCQIEVDLIDPSSNQIVKIGNPKAKQIKVSGRFSTNTAFGAGMGMPLLTIAAQSFSRLPKLDLVLCLDVSDSMDDQTPVTLVKRAWDPGAGKITYQVATNSQGQAAQGLQSNIAQANVVGSELISIAPQHLSGAWFDNRFLFSEYISQQQQIPPLRSTNPLREAGTPPGNFPNSLPSQYAGNQIFSDMVVNVDGRNQFGGITSGGYAFPDLATVVEAARGNLENGSVFVSSKANTAVSVTPMSGYQKQYLKMAQGAMNPLQDVKASCSDFLNTMDSNTDTHFSLLTFATSASSSSANTETHGAIDEQPPYGSGYGPMQQFTLPYVGLSNQSSNLSQVQSVVQQISPLSGTNFGGAIDASLTMLQGSQVRPDATKVIVLFTDGIPTVAPGYVATTDPPPYGPPSSYARQIAAKAAAAGIPVFTVGLAQNPQLIPLQDAILNNTNPDPSTGGIAAIAGHGGQYVRVVNPGDLSNAFRIVSRKLISLIFKQ